jgi:hypothetical protein
MSNKSAKTHILYGCFYPHPEKDDPSNPRAPPRDYRNLREWQLRELCPKMKNLPIHIYHHATGILHDSDGTAHKCKSIISGGTPAGRVLDAWMNPADSSAHFIAEITYDNDNAIFGDLLARDFFSACSLTHGRECNGDPLRVIELSLCKIPARPGSNIYWGSQECRNYLCETGWVEYNYPKPKIIMASASTTTEAVAMETSTPALKPPPISQPGDASQILETLHSRELPSSILADIEKTPESVLLLLDTLAKRADDFAAKSQQQRLDMLRATDGLMRDLNAAHKEEKPWQNLTEMPSIIKASASASAEIDALFSAVGNLTTALQRFKDGDVSPGEKRSRTAVPAMDLQYAPNAAKDVGAPSGPPGADILTRAREHTLAELRRQADYDAVTQKWSLGNSAPMPNPATALPATVSASAGQAASSAPQPKSQGPSVASQLSSVLTQFAHARPAASTDGAKISFTEMRAQISRSKIKAS